MNDTEITGSASRRGSLIELQPQQLVQIAVLGIVVGIIYWLLTVFLRHVIFIPMFCAVPSSSGCATTTDMAGGFAAIFSGMVGLMGLVRFSVFRPLLIVIASAIALWGLGSWVSGRHWYEAILWSGMLFSLAYMAFAWFVRPRAFGPAVIIVAVMVILARLFAMVQ